jgi:hypothetical protein
MKITVLLRLYYALATLLIGLWIANAYVVGRRPAAHWSDILDPPLLVTLAITGMLVGRTRAHVAAGTVTRGRINSRAFYVAALAVGVLCVSFVIGFRAYA